jgi:hypothetical protein
MSWLRHAYFPAGWPGPAPLGRLTLSGSFRWPAREVEHGVDFPLVHADAEQCPTGGSFDLPCRVRSEQQ